MASVKARDARFVDCDQHSAEWFAARCGCITSSNVADVIAKLKRKDDEAACRRNYRMQLVAERLTGNATGSYVSPAMEWGTETEPLARSAYEIETGAEVERMGFVYHPAMNWAGASPDGLIGEAGLIEIKCPNTVTHIEYLLAECAPEEYQPQMLWLMACTGAAWCDFVSYDPRLPQNLQLFICRFQRDEERIRAMESEVIAFNREVDELVERLRKQNKGWLEDRLEDSLHITERDIAHI